jgi:putative tricarboxylic transport membrane protein
MTRFPNRRRMLQMLGAGGAGAALLGRSGPGHAQSPAWQPTQAVNYLISVAPGGSVDLYARGIKNALESLQLVNGQHVLPDNKPGAAGLMALQVMQRNAGNAHYLATFHTGGIAGQVTGILKADMRDYVPVAMMVEETTLVAVRADSPIRTARDIVDALKRNPGRTEDCGRAFAGPQYPSGHCQASEGSGRRRWQVDGGVLPLLR